MRILLLSAYDAQSHQYWRNNLVAQFPEYSWTVLTLPARYFSWRIRGNSLSWAFNERETLEQPYDLIIATSMTDLSSLKGLVPNLADIPTLVYFHENQFAYPESGREFNSVEPRILNLYTALAADQIAFNSQYNLDTFLSGVATLLKKLPDQVPKGVIEKIEQRVCVLPVPLNKAHLVPSTASGETLNIVWNHRWEYDKGPQALLEAIRRLKTLTEQFTLHVVGQQFRQVPDAFTQLKNEFQDYIGVWGYMASEPAYRRLLQQSDVVVSTAQHDFQGIAVLEAVAAGCIPLVPDRLAYPELFGQTYCYEAEENEATHLAKRLLQLSKLKASGKLPSPPDISSLSWPLQVPHYLKLFEKTIASAADRSR